MKARADKVEKISNPSSTRQNAALRTSSSSVFKSAGRMVVVVTVMVMMMPVQVQAVLPVGYQSPPASAC